MRRKHDLQEHKSTRCESAGVRSVALAVIVLLSALSLQATVYADVDMGVAEKAFLEGKYGKAEAAAQSMIDQRARQRYELYYLKGLSELKLNKFKEARESFETIISKYSSSSRVFDAYIGIGDSYMLGGNAPEAAKTYSDIISRFPKDKNIGIAKERLADCKKGSDLDSSAVETASETPALRPNAIPKNESKGYISVQAGCFKNRRNAESLSKKLAARGYESYVELPMGSDDNLYRVKVGRLSSREEAESIAAKLRRDGYKTKTCDASE